MQGIYSVSIPITDTPLPVVIGTDGHLGTSSGGGGVSGNCNTLGQNYITKWFNGSTVECSHIYEESTSGNNFVGIGPPFNVPSPPPPTRQLQVTGDIDIPVTITAHYQITGNTVLSIDGPGQDNTLVGVGAGLVNNPGQDNTFTGFDAGVANVSGGYNSYYGSGAGGGNVVGQENTCVGKAACEHSTGSNNTILGSGAGLGNFTGSNNTFVGWSAGTNTTNGDNDIYVGSNVGVTSESNTIRIGNQGTQTATFVAGIFPPSTPTGVFPVCVSASGQLFSIPAFSFCNSSSRRFKEQISDMGDSSSKLLQLHPVTYFYKPQYDDGSHLLQYGLIAEEVAKVYPEMVAYEKDGQPYTVKYQLLAPMLLNELQKQHRVVAAQQDELQTQLQQIKTQEQQMQAQRQEIAGLKLQLQQQNASLQERLSKLESYVATQIKTASDNPPRTAPGANGGLQ
jgi:hypothetical protein